MPWPDWQQRHDAHRQPRRVDYTRPGFVRPADPEPDPWCRREDCRHRNWRSGSMPTHRRGEDCPSDDGGGPDAA